MCRAGVYVVIGVSGAERGLRVEVLQSNRRGDLLNA